MVDMNNETKWFLGDDVWDRKYMINMPLITLDNDM